MKHTKLYPILFEADDALLSGGDIGKDVADAVKTALEPVTKDLEQMKKDINVIQKSSGERKQEPTKSRSTTGPEQTAAATTIPKGPGTKSTTGTSGGTGADNVDQLNTQQKIDTKKIAADITTNLATNKDLIKTLATSIASNKTTKD